MDLLAQKDSWLVYALFAIGAVMLVYTLYLLVEQRRSLVFEVSRGPWTYVVSVGLIAFAVGYYFFAGQSLKEVATGSVLFAFAIFMAAVRNGVGRTGVYIDGVRYAWSKVDVARVAKDHGNPVVTFRIKDIERPIRLPGCDVKEVSQFVGEMGKSYGFNTK